MAEKKDRKEYFREYFRDYRDRKRFEEFVNFPAGQKPCRALPSFISHDTGIPMAVTSAVLKSFVRFVVSELQKGNRVTVEGLGNFRLKHYKGRNFPLGESPEADRVRFKASTKLKEAIWEVRKPVYKAKPVSGENLIEK